MRLLADDFDYDDPERYDPLPPETDDNDDDTAEPWQPDPESLDRDA